MFFLKYHTYLSHEIHQKIFYFSQKAEKHSRRLFDKKDEKWEISNIFILILQTKLRARA
jgi:hypothetical protein